MALAFGQPRQKKSRSPKDNLSVPGSLHDTIPSLNALTVFHRNCSLSTLNLGPQLSTCFPLRMIVKFSVHVSATCLLVWGKYSGVSTWSSVDVEMETNVVFDSVATRFTLDKNALFINLETGCVNKTKWTALEVFKGEYQDKSRMVSRWKYVIISL